MTISASASTLFVESVLAARAGASPKTFYPPLPVPRTASECDHLLEATRRRMRSPEARPFFARELARFLGAGSSVWSQERREMLRTVLAEAGESGVDAVLEAVARTSRADSSDDAEAVLREVLVRSPAVASTLSRRFEQTTSPAVRASIVRALGESRMRLSPTLLSAIDDADVEVRDAAATALGRQRGTTARAVLTRRLAREKSPAVRESIESALDELGSG